MKKIWILIKREFIEAVYKKSFIILTILIPIIMIGMGVVPTLLIGLDSEEPVRLDVIDESQFVYSKLKKALDETLKNGENYGFNLICNLDNPDVEMETIKLYMDSDITRIEASAFMQITPALVLYHLKNVK